MASPSETDERPAARRALGIYVGVAAGLAVFFVALQWVVERREIAAERDHRIAVAQAALEPGTPVTDPALPAGVVEVDLVPVAPDLPLEQPATLRAGGRRVTWAPGSPARFEGLADDRRLPLSITGPYAVEGASIAAPAGSRGARVAARAIPLSPPRPLRDPPGMSPEKRLEVSLRAPGMVELTWKQGFVVISEREVPREPAAALAARIREEWKAQRSHFDAQDRKRDEAVVRVGPADSFADVLFLVEAVLAPEREMIRGGAPSRVPAFAVVVVQPSL